jgi:hypothetical protein
MNGQTPSAPRHAGTVQISQITESWTVGAIARFYSVPIHRIAYVIRSRSIAPVSRAGHAFVFDAETVKAIGDELRQIENERDAGKGGI